MLEELLGKCTFKEDGVYLNNSGLDMLKLYHFMHSAIADDHLPVYKICGFNVSSLTKSSHIGSVTERNASVLENTLEISYNLTDKVFIDPKGSIANVADFKGSLDIPEDNDIIVTNAKYPRIIRNNPHVLTAIQPITLKCILRSGTGYSDMENTAKKILQDTAYFPMAVRFSIHDYCRICPPSRSDRVAYRMSDGFTHEDLKYHFLALLSKRNELSKEDIEWLSSYEQ